MEKIIMLRYLSFIFYCSIYFQIWFIKFNISPFISRYCVEFEVTKAAKACHKLPPYNKLAEGNVETLVKFPRNKDIIINSIVCDR